MSETADADDRRYAMIMIFAIGAIASAIVAVAYAVLSYLLLRRAKGE